MKLLWSMLTIISISAWGQAPVWAELSVLPDEQGVTISSALTVVLGDTLPTELEARHLDPSQRVHVLTSTEQAAHRLRQTIRDLKCYGPVSVQPWAKSHLPYADHLVNTLVVMRPGSVRETEVLRVLCPEGKVYFHQGASWRVVQKTRPRDMDEWTHYLYDSSGNAVANDHQVGPPGRLQWCTQALMTRDHDGLASMSSMVSANGRLFYIYDEGPISQIHHPPAWKLVARDAFNGIVLWKRPIPDWVTSLYHFRAGPVWLQRRLVALDECVYVPLGLEAPVSAVDARTGKTLFTFPGTEKTEEFIAHGRVLLAVTGDPAKANREAGDPYLYTEYTIGDRHPVAKTIVACDLETGGRLWELDDASLRSLTPLSMCASGERAYYLDRSHLHCLRVQDGKPLWRAPYATEGAFLRAYAPTVVATPDAVLCLTNKRLAAFCAAEGKLLWDKAGYVGFAAPGDLFVIDDLVWTLPTTATLNALRPAGGTFLGKDGTEFLGIDLGTGRVQRSLDRTEIYPTGHHHRCYRNKATTKYFICGRRGVEFISPEDDHFIHNWWIRGICQYGVMPANGLLYVPPDPCRCFSNIKLNGFLALAKRSEKGEVRRVKEQDRLVKGPAYGDFQSAPSTLHPSSWPTYRRDPMRSGSTTTEVPVDLAEEWKVKFSGRISAATVAHGRVFVAEVDAHTVHCLNAASGAVCWTFTAHARIDSPPTIHGKLAVFGSRDGWVYALDVSQGHLAWKFQAAAQDRYIVKDNQLESSWPVSGSVLIMDDIAYFVAGRSSFLQGGVTLYGLQVGTGEKTYERKIVSPPVTQSRRGPTGGALPSILCADGDTIAMRGMTLDRALQAVKPSKSDLLTAATGFLDSGWFHRTNWNLGSGPTAPWGKLIVFDEAQAYGIQNPYTYQKFTPSNWPDSHQGHHHQRYSNYTEDHFPRGVRFFAQPRKVTQEFEYEDNIPGALKAFKRFSRPQMSSTRHHTWTHNLPMQARALIKAGAHVYVAGWGGPGDALNAGLPTRPTIPFDPAVLLVFRAQDGEPLTQYRLQARPAFDGMAAADQRLYLSLQDGTLLCLGSQ